MGESRKPCPQCKRQPGQQHIPPCPRILHGSRIRKAANVARERIRAAAREELRREAVVRAALAQHRILRSSRILGPDGKPARKEQP